MSLENRPLPGLFGGVSQQTPALRHETQCDLQDNYLSTVTEGLCKRPSTYHIIEADGTMSAAADRDAFVHFMDYGATERYKVVINGSTIEVYNVATGVKATVTMSAATPYITASEPWKTLRAATVADVTFITNTTVAVAMDPATSAANSTNRAFFVINTATTGVKYTLEVNAVTANHTATNTDTPGTVATALVTALSTALGAGWSVATLTAENAIIVQKTSGSITSQSYSDSFGGTLGICINDGVSKFEKLPGSFVNDFVVTIRANTQDKQNDYYVKFDSTAKRYVEVVGPGLTFHLDPTTMPHRLTRTAVNTFTYEAPDVWGQRAAGDNDTVPLPSFVGSAVRDIFFHRNRLGFLTAKGTVVLSRSGDFIQFFAPSALNALVSDPIDLEAASDAPVSLRWAVKLEKELLVFGEKQQFAIVGGDILSPENATLPEVAKFECSALVRPQPMGERVVFVIDAGTGLQVQMLQLKDFSDTRWEAIDLTDHVPTYIPAGARALAVSTVAKAIVVSQQGAATAYVMKWEDGDNRSLRQKAWQRFTFERSAPGGTHYIAGMAFVQDILFLTSAWSSGATSRIEFSRMVVRGEPAEQIGGTPFDIKLDRKALVSASYNSGSNQTTVTVPYALTSGTYASLVLLRGSTGIESDPAVIAGSASVSQAFNAHTTTLVFTGDITAPKVTCGFRYSARYRFTELIMKDNNGVPIEASRLRVKKLIARLVRSGYIEIQVTPFLRALYTYPYSGRIVGVPGYGLGQAPVSSQVIEGAVGARPFGTLVELFTESHYPAIVPYAEWVFTITLRSRR